MKRKPEPENEKAEVDLTPMLDVVFILLIFFIVTATFVSESVVDVNVPANSPATHASSTVLIQINANDEVIIDGRKVDKRSVKAVMAQKLSVNSAENKESRFLVRAHEAATAQAYVAIADALQQLLPGSLNANVSLVTWTSEE
jgi:biopolymer transport protein ExbD